MTEIQQLVEKLRSEAVSSARTEVENLRKRMDEIGKDILARFEAQIVECVKASATLNNLSLGSIAKIILDGGLVWSWVYKPEYGQSLALTYFLERASHALPWEKQPSIQVRDNTEYEVLVLIRPI